MNVSDFDYDLPSRYIAQTPQEPRDSAKLMRLERDSGILSHHIFSDILDMVNAGDVLVLNNTRVIPARLRARKAETGGAVEILLLKRLDELRWLTLIGGRNVLPGMKLQLSEGDASCVVLEQLDVAQRVVEFDRPIHDILDRVGKLPLPPYIRSQLDDSERYQTVYSNSEGSAAAPTAGLHFTPELLIKLRQKGVKIAYCTLHIGLDTFQPVSVEEVNEHKIHSEFAKLDAMNARIINESKLSGGRIIAVGTTSARTLETAGILSAGGDLKRPETDVDSCPWCPVVAFETDTNLFIYPGYKWRVVDGMITNFHLPRSTLLMMLSSFAGREQMLYAYNIAQQMDYRFYSFGDAMFIT